MSCVACEGVGIVPFVASDNPKPDADVGRDDLYFALCLCPAAAWYRSDVNAGKRTSFYGWQVWAAREQVSPERVHRIEDVYSAAELAAVGLSKQPADFNREAALLTASKTRKVKL